MKRTFNLLMLIAASLALNAQDFEVPKDYRLVDGEDYAPYEQDIIHCVDWLINTPLNEQTEKRADANKFLLQWLTGSPDVHIEIKPEIVTFLSTTPDLLMIFMGGWAKYSLKTKKFDDKINGTLKGIESVIEFYQKNRGFLKKDKHVEKYIKMQEKGKLTEYVEKNA